MISDAISSVSIEDADGGEFVMVEQNSGKLVIDPEEWEELKAAIDYAIAECRPAKKKNAGDDAFPSKPPEGLGVE